MATSQEYQWDSGKLCAQWSPHSGVGGQKAFTLFSSKGQDEKANRDRKARKRVFDLTSDAQVGGSETSDALSQLAACYDLASRLLVQML